MDIWLRFRALFYQTALDSDDDNPVTGSTAFLIENDHRSTFLKKSAVNFSANNNNNNNSKSNNIFLISNNYLKKSVSSYRNNNDNKEIPFNKENFFS